MSEIPESDQQAQSASDTAPSQSAVFAASEPFTEQSSFGVDGFNPQGPTLLGSPIPQQHSFDATCLDVHRSLPVFLDGELAIHQADAVQRHLTTCGPCQSAQAFQMQLRTTVASKAIDPMPSEVRERIARALGFDQHFGDTER